MTQERLVFRRIEGFTGLASKIKGEGAIRYCLWVDGVGNLYAQFEENVIDTHEPGSYTGLLYKISRYASFRDADAAITDLEGYDINRNTWRAAEGSNNGGFLKAVLRHLLP